MSALSSTALSKIYRGGLGGRQRVAALVDFSLDVRQGEVFSLLGPNGAGKTTFIKILLSLTHPTSGQVSMLGRALPDVAVREKVGYLPENHRYPAYLSGTQVLQFFGRLGAVDRQTLRTRIPALLSLVGLSDWAGVRVRKYSKGMMQRLGLAQALINDPTILFLDEPTDGVDPVGRKEIREILRNLKEQGKTIFLNSHLLSEVELISDRVAILDRGRLLKVGTVDELTSPGSIYQIGVAGEIPDALLQETTARVMKVTFAVQTVSIECQSTRELNILIDILRKHGVEITSVARQRNTLEESFITLIKREVGP